METLRPVVTVALVHEYAMSGLETHHLADLPENHLAG